MPAVLASDIRKRYQKKNNNKNKKKEKATDKKVASSSSTPKPAVKGVQSKPKSTTPSKPKSTVKSKKNTGSGMTSTEAARHGIRTQTAGERARHKSSQEMTDYRWYKDFEKRSQAKKKNLENTGMTSTERARHQASYENKLAFGDYLKDKIQAQKEYDEYVEQRDKDRRKSYELQHKNTGRYANAVNPAHSRGMSYSANPNAGSMESRKNNETYFLKQALSGAWSIPEDVGKAVESVYNPTGKKENKALKTAARIISPAIVGYNDIKGDRYEKFNEQLNKDVRANDFSSQVAQGLGRMLPTLPLYAVGAGGALANLGKVNKATKAISTLAKPMSTAGAAVNTAAYYGERYDEAIKNGATPEQARKAALAYALPTAYLEGMGGAEKAFSKAIKPGFNPLKTAVKSGLSEGLEEVAQTPWEEYTKKAYGKNIPLFGRGSQEAVFNPDQLFNSFAVGAVLGAAGGGASGLRVKTGISTSKKNIIDAVNENKIKINNEIMQDLKDNKISQEEADLRRKYLDHEAKRASDEAIAKIDKDAEIAMYGNASSEEPGEYNAPEQREWTQQESEELDELFKQQLQDFDEEDVFNDDLEMDEEERLYGEQEFGTRKRNRPQTQDNEEITKTETTPPPKPRPRGGALTMVNILDNADERQRADEIRAKIDAGDYDFVLNDRRDYGTMFDIAAEELSGETKENGRNTINSLADQVAFVSKKIEENKGRSNDVINAELAILFREADIAQDYVALENIERLISTTGTPAGRELSSRRMFRMLTPAGKAFLMNRQAQREAEKVSGFNSAEIIDKVDGKKADGSNNTQTAMEDFLNSDIIDDFTEDSDVPKSTLVKDIRRTSKKRRIKKVLDSSGRAYDSKSLLKKIKADEEAKMNEEFGFDDEFGFGEESETPGEKRKPLKFSRHSNLNDRYVKELQISLKLNPKTEKLITKYPKIKTIIREVMAENPPDVREAIAQNDIGVAAYYLAEEVAQRVDVRVDDLIGQRQNEKKTRGERYGEVTETSELDHLIFDYIYKNLAERARKLRDNELKKLFAQASKGSKGSTRKKFSFIKELMYYNNLGLLDDPNDAAAVYKELNSPYISRSELTAMIARNDLAEKVRNGEIDKIVSDQNLGFDEKEMEKVNKVLNKKLKQGDTEYVADALEQLAMKIPEEKLVGNIGQKLRQWQITAMLLNGRTFLRNILPNMTMLPVNLAGRPVGALADKALAKFSGSNTKIYGGISNPKELGKNLKAGAGRAVADYRLGIDTSQTNKSELSKRHAFNNNSLPGRTVNKATNTMNLLLKLGDQPFESAYYNQALNGMSQLFEDGKPMPIAEELAQLEAMQNTFKDDNMFTQATQTIVDGLNLLTGASLIGSGSVKGSYGLGSAVVPFVRTPANLTKLMVDYSPVGAFAEGAVYAVKSRLATDPDEKLRYQYKAANSVSHLVSGLLVGIIMVALDKFADDQFEITGGFDDDDWQKNEYERQVHGKQEYAIRIGDRWFNYSSLQPIGSLMAMAVDTYEAITNPKENDEPWRQQMVDALLNGVIGAGDMLYESSVYKGIGDILKGSQNPVDVAATAVSNVPTQFLPALFQQFAKAVDPWQRDTTSDDPLNPIRILEEGGNKFKNNVPFLSRTLPKKTDAYGLPMERYDSGTVGDFLNTFVNPFTTTHRKTGNLSSITDTEEKVRLGKAIEEIERINGVYDSKYGLLPTTAKRTIDIGDETIRLTGAERQKWQKDAGYEYLKNVADIMEDPNFAGMSDFAKGYVIEKTKEAFRYQARKNIADKHDIKIKKEAQFEKVLETVKAVKGSVAEYYTYKKKAADFAKKEYDPDDESHNPIDYKRGWMLDSSGLSKEKIIGYMRAYGYMDGWDDEMEAAKQKDIDELDYLRAKTEMTIIANDRELGTKEKEYKAALLVLKYGKNSDQQQWLATTINKMGWWLQDEKLKNGDFYNGDENALISIVDPHDSWNGNDKYCKGIAGKDVFDSMEQFCVASDMVKKTNKEETVAEVDKLNLSAAAKACILASKGFSANNVSFHDGGSVDVVTSSGSSDSVMPSEKNTKKSSTASSETPISSTPIKTSGTLATQVRQLKNQFKAMNTAANSVISRTAGSAKNIVEGIMPSKPTSYEGAYLTSEFGWRESPGGVGSTNHQGIDIGVNGQTDVGALSITPGTIIFAGKKGGHGLCVEWMGADGNAIRYSHLSSIAKGLKAGDHITSGQQVGIIGDTGSTTGINLHIEVHPGGINEAAVDPQTVYDFFGDGLKQKSANPDYQADSSFKSSSSSSSSSSGGGGGGGKGGSGSSKKKRKPISTGSSYGSYSYGGYTPSSSYSSGYTPGNYTPGSYNP